MEKRFGSDFSQVRIHTDAQAAQSAQEVNGLAYTVGRNVVFGHGRYAPTTNEGQRLLAHEMTHVLQQTGHIPVTGVPQPVARPAVQLKLVGVNRLLRDVLGEGTTSMAIVIGDRFRLTVRTLDGFFLVSEMMVQINERGNIYFDPFDARIRVLGLSLAEAEATLVAELSRRARVALQVELVAVRLAGREVSRQPASTGTSGHSDADISQRMSQFNAYLATTTEPADAVIRYYRWLQEHRNSPELFQIEPHELWSQSLRAPQPQLTPRQEREQLYLSFMRNRQERIGRLEGDERRRETEAMSRFLD